MRSAIAFLTPFGSSSSASVPTASTPSWFPVVGALQGLALGLLWWLLDDLMSSPAAAGIVVVGDLVLTGMLHMDGLADSADGLLPPIDKARRLEVMKSPEVGAFGVAAVVGAMMLRFAALVSLEPSPLLLSGLWCASRTSMACAIRSMQYARSSGLASAFVGAGSSAWVIGSFGLLGSILISVIGALAVGAPSGAGTEWASVLGVIGVVGGAWAVLRLAKSRLGGFTGDVLGAAGVVGETVGLLLVTVRL